MLLFLQLSSSDLQSISKDKKKLLRVCPSKIYGIIECAMVHIRTAIQVLNKNHMFFVFFLFLQPKERPRKGNFASSRLKNAVISVFYTSITIMHSSDQDTTDLQHFTKHFQMQIKMHTQDYIKQTLMQF